MESTELYELRMLIFLEKEPQSNKYYQVMVDAEQYKTITEAISKNSIAMDGMISEGTTMTSEEEYTLPDLKNII